MDSARYYKSMNSTVRRILMCAIVMIWWCSGQNAIAGTVSDRLAQYPDWNSQPSVSQHQGELTYPDWFRGRWLVTSTLLEQTAPLAPAVVTPGFDSNRQYINKPIEFVVQFVPNNSPQATKITLLNLPRIKANLPEPQIVADRAFNGLKIAAIYLGANNVKSVKIDPQNPTKQITQLSQDRQLEAFVTGFDREIPKPNQFISTELSQQVFRTSDTIYLNTVETTTSYQLTATPTPKISATQISAIYLSPQDPNYFRSIGIRGTRPVALYKYQLDLVPDLS
jgi:hypothetical protein